MSEMINISIKCTNSETAIVTVEKNTTISDLKLKIAEKISIPASIQRLVYKGKVLKDELTADFYDIQDGHVVHLVKTVQNAAAISTGSPVAAPSSTSSPQATQSSQSMSDPFGMGMGGLGGMGGMGMDMNSMQQQMLRNPDMMQSMLNSPMMDQILSNPELMSSMMMSNPQIQALMQANPQMRHALSDPQIIRQQVEMMRNPRMMQEAMRQQDVALSQLENHPEGYNMLTRMYEQMESAHAPEPSSARSGASPGASASTTPSTVPNTSALPNPWGPPPTSSPQGLGAGFPGMGMGGLGQQPGMGMGGMGMPNPSPEQAMAMMQNPFFQQQMQMMANNPQMLQQALSMNPALANNPATRALLSNPEMLRQVMNPANMQAMLQMQQSMTQLQQAGLIPPVQGMGGLPGFGPSFGAPPAGGGVPGAAGGIDFSQMLGGWQPGSVPTTAPTAVQPPTERYATQLRQLSEMGFTDETANLRALGATGGNVTAAVERLLSGA